MRRAVSDATASFVIPGFVTGIHPTPRSGVCGELDPGNKCRDDTVRNRQSHGLGRKQRRALTGLSEARKATTSCQSPSFCSGQLFPPTQRML
jgi:hypothetical protein